jgi:carbonic anhydrase
MCENCRRLKRRDVLKTASIVAAAAVFTPSVFAAPPKAPVKPYNVLSPDAALDRLMNGNRRYVEGNTKRHDFAHEREALSTGQNPFAAILSCADSRVAPEYCFDTARGDLFVCRVAGNFASDDIIASLEYAISVLNVPLVMVLGHEACGAVDATIKSVKEGTTLPGHLPALVSAITPAVSAAQGMPGNLLTNATRQNVSMNVEKLKYAPPILNAAFDNKTIRVVGGVYMLKSGRVDLLA